MGMMECSYNSVNEKGQITMHNIYIYIRYVYISPYTYKHKHMKQSEISRELYPCRGHLGERGGGLQEGAWTHGSSKWCDSEATASWWPHFPSVYLSVDIA